MPADPTDSDQPLYGAAPFTAYGRFWRRYAVFSGRASLSEYWWPVLLNTVIGVALGVIGGGLLAVGAVLAQQGDAVAALPNSVGAVLLFALVVLALAQIVPAIAISVRRLHDANLSGLLFLLVLIPSVGGLILLVLNVLPSDPRGRRYDRGAPPWSAMVPPGADASPAPAAPAANGGFDAWPDPEGVAPATAQLPAQDPAPPNDAAQGPDDALETAWRTVGEVEPLEAGLGVQPSWRRQRYLLVRRPDGVAVLTTNGLAEAEGAAALGAGAEVYLPCVDAGPTAEAVADGWRFTILAAVARRIGASGMHLPAELEQYGALSMSVQADAPDDWRGEDGAVGVLIGVGLPDVPETVASAAGEVRLVGLTPLRPDELRRILDGGREARGTIAARLASLPPAVLTDPQRASV